MPKIFRQGATGALLDEYERAISDLKKVIKKIPDSRLPVLIMPPAADENCSSIQAILSHVISSGYGYATSIHVLKGHTSVRPAKTFHFTISSYLQQLTDLFLFTLTVFEEIKDEELEQLDNALKIKVNWGQQYDIEQLTEHAIVHILRHRRQIERILINLPY